MGNFKLTASAQNYVERKEKEDMVALDEYEWNGIRNI